MSNVVNAGNPLVSAELTLIANLLALATSPAGQAIAKTSSTTFSNVTASGGGSGYQAPLTGDVDGVNDTFTWTTAPSVLMIDRVPTQKVSSDGTVNWVGTVSTVLTTIPFEDLFAVA